MTDHSHVGSLLDDLLEEDGILAEVNAVAFKRVLAWQISQEMQKRGLSKSKMARSMNTSRPALERLLDPSNTSITLKTMERAATILAKRLRIELVDYQESKIK
ncbi:helix-turn-helix domain-containing protein [Candidatus Synechococcus calcipolaris G9]|uniref:Helix-turn-helix domain-containing protein n=1 Tax=Candidatus Synechococcus calcipolaris G9 TaxID=1497997 RepID=A0ABT6F199_9SYNE|nr:Fis family transcriptional regulator [Candidatus Synechococcus calcipolaris]MDG2991631.1 helix-turn-helix domain-containing protein [Candidatus Synechococcus calcipolaris G9]